MEWNGTEGQHNASVEHELVASIHVPSLHTHGHAAHVTLVIDGTPLPVERNVFLCHCLQPSIE